jgi:membrane glycosyltransferase
MRDRSSFPTSPPRSTTYWRHAVFVTALVGTSVVVAACSTSTSPSGAGPTNHSSTSTLPATDNKGAAAVCADVNAAQATLTRTQVVPADDVQKILADSQSSGNAKLESEASTLASASHIVDAAGTAAALASMVATCQSVTTTS